MHNAAHKARGARAPLDWEAYSRGLAEQLRAAREAAAVRERKHQREMDALVTRQAEVNRELVAANASLTAEITRLKTDMRVLRHGYACLELSVAKVVPVLHAELEAASTGAPPTSSKGVGPPEGGAARCGTAAAEAAEPAWCSSSEEEDAPPQREVEADITGAEAEPSHHRACAGLPTSPVLPPTPPDGGDNVLQLSSPELSTCDSPDPPPDRRRSVRPRRRSLATAAWGGAPRYREPSVRAKLRQGMAHTFQ